MATIAMAVLTAALVLAHSYDSRGKQERDVKDSRDFAGWHVVLLWCMILVEFLRGMFR